jgi:MarR family transcriptional regulator, organic hydroperoxide resistance regulator
VDNVPDTPRAGEAENGGPDHQLDGVLNFMRLLWAVDHGLQSRSKQMASTLGVTGPQRLAIRLAARFPQITAGQLAEMLHVHPSTLTGVLQRLVARGILVREHDPADGRRALFRVTSKGRKIDQTLAGTAEEVVTQALDKVGPKEREAAERVLAELAEMLKGA